MDRYLITSVLGFDFKTEVRDLEGKVISTGIKRTCYTCSKDSPKIGNKLANRKWFNHYNQALIDKIRDLRRLND